MASKYLMNCLRKIAFHRFFGNCNLNFEEVVVGRIAKKQLHYCVWSETWQEHFSEPFYVQTSSKIGWMFPFHPQTTEGNLPRLFYSFTETIIINFVSDSITSLIGFSFLSPSFIKIANDSNSSDGVGFDWNLMT